MRYLTQCVPYFVESRQKVHEILAVMRYEPRYDKTNKMAMRSAKTQISWASAQSDQSLRCPHEESLGPQLPIERPTKTLIRLGGCPG